ncbi:MAG: hypothetical protein JWM36_595 [Hyphomicrobiales bacterium]|nr:hypothetical protein [Hyphomicrobiales bacterium]
MPDFSDILVELRTGLEDPDAFRIHMRSEIDPDLVDRLSAFGASRGMSFAETILRAVEMFMLAAAEDAWRSMADDREADAPLGGAPFNTVLERFLSTSLDVSRQARIAGPPSAIHTLFRRTT